MVNWHKVLIAIVVLVVVIFAAYEIFACPSCNDNKNSGKDLDTFAQCLTDSGATMYGAYWCPHCQNQKEMFGESFQYINYVECDPNGENANPSACDAAGITGYPTWVLENGERLLGEQSLETLAEKTGCEMLG